MEQWIQQELEKTDDRDKRRTHRLMKIVSNLSANPSASVPLASRTWAETKATSDFWDSPYLQPLMLLPVHIGLVIAYFLVLRYIAQGTSCLGHGFPPTRE